MSRHDLTDAQWQMLEPLLPQQRLGRGRPRTDNHKCLSGILYVLKTGVAWADLPVEYGSPTTCWRRFDEWSQLGVWEAVWQTLLASLDRAGKIEWAAAFLDGSFVPSKKGAMESDAPRLARAAK